MITHWNPRLVSRELIALTRSLADPQKDLVILAEGNTSQRLEESSIAVKASGTFMSESAPEHFVIVDVDGLIRLVDDPATTQADLSAALDAGVHEGTRRRASIETLIHAAIQSVHPTAFVAHTHPTSVVSLLASVHAETAFDQWVYSDEAIIIGAPLFVPYAEPGIALGRLFLARLRAQVEKTGEVPSLTLLGNHGIVAAAGSAAAAEAITLMAVKGARVRLAALSAGGVRGLGSDLVEHYSDRQDMAERRALLAGRA